MEHGRAEAEKSGVKRTTRDLRGRISFEKTLRSTAVSPFYVLTLPSSLWRQHGEKIQEFVILQSAADRKKWTVKACINFRNGTGSPCKYPQVTLQNGWKAFVVANGLVKGDQLKFTLTAISKFEVFKLRSGVEPKVPSVQSPKLGFAKFSPKSKDAAISQRYPKKPLGRQCINSIGKSSVKSERVLAAKKVTAEDSIVHSASNVADASESNSDMDPNFNEPMLQQNEQRGALLKSFNDTDYHSQSAHPFFSKRISDSSAPEIPCRFLKSHWTQIGSTHVKLQGIHEESQVDNIMCTSVIDGGRPRLFFKSCCWNNFVKDNSLQIGQKLRFTLTADSFFTVRNSE